jgi:hypothetical protein
MSNVKLPAHRAELPEKEVSFILCPLTPPTRRGLRGTSRSKPNCQMRNLKPEIPPGGRQTDLVFDIGMT